MTRTDKEYWNAHNVFESLYNHKQRATLFSHAIPSIDDAIEFCGMMRGEKFSQRMTDMEKSLRSPQGSTDDKMRSFIEGIVSLIEWFPLITEYGLTKTSPGEKSLALLLTRASWDMKNVKATTKTYIQTIDSFTTRTLEKFSPEIEKFHELYEMTLEAQKEGGPRYDALIWTFASHNNCLYQAIAISALKGEKNFAEAIASLTRSNDRNIQKYQRIVEKERMIREQTETSGEQTRNSLRLKSEELAALEKVCDKKEEQIKELNTQVEKFSKGTTPSRELTVRVERLETEIEEARDKTRKSEEEAGSWKELAEGEERTVERLRRTITELWDVVHGEEPTKEETPSRRERYESRLQKAGLDYTIVDAIIISGLKCGKFVGESYLPVRHVKTNTFCKLRAPEQVEFVEAMIQELVRANAVCIKKNDTAISINPHTKEITIPALKEYIIECLDDARKLKTGKPVKNGE